MQGYGGARDDCSSMNAKGRFTGKITDVMRRVMNALESDGDMTADDLADHLGITVSYVRQYGIYPLREAELIRVSSWIRGARGCPMRVFSLSVGKDAPRPKRLPWSVTNKRWQERHAAGLTKANNSLALLVRLTAPSQTLRSWKPRAITSEKGEQ